MLMDASLELSNAFLSFSRQKLIGEMWPRLCSCLDELTEEQIWWRPNQSSNSIGNLLLHLNGNIRQWLVGSFRQLKDERNRPAEFSASGAIAGRDLLEQLAGTLREAGDVLSTLSETELTAEYEIQGTR